MKTLKNIFIALISVILVGCASLYDQVTYDETVATKAQTLKLMDKSSEPFSSHESEVDALKKKLAERLAYEKGKKQNAVTTKMWEVLNSDKKLIKTYLDLWKQKGTLSKPFIEQAKPEIETAFNLLIDYESRKDKKGTQITDFIKNL